MNRNVAPTCGATLCTAVISGSDIMFMLFPIAAGSMLLVIIAILVINLVPGREYPSYWW
ncbi:HPP family protein [Desulfoscipio geothermicus]|uniref:HPP family protein n=1 Tax=Desulfoscipio geothermicus TaxID=39060 RepID=UPI003CCB7ECA